MSERSRKAQLERLGNGTFDALVLGGGITGVAASHVLTRRGYRVALVDNCDFASGVSQESSQLIWGGIKYLENRHFKVVRELCLDRNDMARRYPGRIQPLPFLYPHFDHDPHSLWTLLMGAHLYRVLGNFYAERPRRFSTASIVGAVPTFRPVGFTNGFQYFDAHMADSDARLALDFLFDAMDAGLTAANYLELREAKRVEDVHQVDFTDSVSGDGIQVRAKWIVNTTGIWADEVNERLGVETPHRHLFSKGIHLIIPRIETGERALTCLSKEGRVFFVVPWGAVTLVGTTDTPFEQGAQRVKPDATDIEYLRAECEAKFNLKLGVGDILNTKAGLRPLLRPAKNVDDRKNFLALARDHKVWSDSQSRLTCLWGGKYTNCFSMGEEIAATIPFAPSHTPTNEIPAIEPTHNVDTQLWDSDVAEETLRQAMQCELVVKPEDFLRRRTNIAMKIANGGRGKNGEHAEKIARIERILAS